MRIEYTEIYVIYLSELIKMPIEPSTNPTTPAPTPAGDPTPNNSSVTSQISDLGDILMDQTMDNVQSTDFQAVSHDDVHGMDEINLDTNSLDALASVDIDAPVISEASDSVHPMDTTNPLINDLSIDLNLDDTTSTANSTDNFVDNTGNEVNLDDDTTIDVNVEDVAVPNDEANIEPMVGETPVMETVAINESTWETPTPDLLPEISIEAGPAQIPSTDTELQNIALDSLSNSEDTNALFTTDTSDIASTEVAPSNPIEEGINFDALADMSLPESSTMKLNEETVDQKDIPVVVEKSENNLANNMMNNTSETERVPTEVGVEPVQEEVIVQEEILPDQPEQVVEPASVLEEPVLVEEPEVTNNVPVSEVSQPEEPIVVQQQAQPMEVVPVQAETSQELLSETPVNSVNIEDKLMWVAEASEKVEANMGMDLDSLVTPQENNNSGTNANTFVMGNVDVDAQAASVAAAAAVNANNRKPLKMALIGMGIVAVAWVLYFGYSTVFPVGLINSSDTVLPMYTGEVTTGDMLSGDVMSGNVLTWDNIFGSGFNIDGSTMSGDATWIGTSTGNATTITRTLEDVKADAEVLATKVRKLLIKATIAKNGPARVTAFSIQKDIDTFQQSLANTSDIDTLSDSENTLSQLSQRLTSLEDKLNGTNNQ